MLSRNMVATQEWRVMDSVMELLRYRSTDLAEISAKEGEALEFISVL